MASKKDWNATREEVVNSLVQTIEGQLLIDLAARGLSDWIQNKVQSLKLATTDDKCKWIVTLKVAEIGNASRDTHENLNMVILTGVANGKVSAHKATQALGLDLEGKRSYITANNL